MLDMSQRAGFPDLHSSGAHPFGARGSRPIVQISTDAFGGYPSRDGGPL